MLSNLRKRGRGDAMVINIYLCSFLMDVAFKVLTTLIAYGILNFIKSVKK